MASVNKVILIGNLGVDPEVRYTPGGAAVANFRIACNDTWTDKNGQRQERTEWVRIVAWGKTAELCGEFLAKGRQVYIEGRLQTREWTDKENRKQWTTEVVANQVVFLGGQGQGSGGGRREPGSEDFGSPPSDYGEGSFSEPQSGGYGGKSQSGGYGGGGQSAGYGGGGGQSGGYGGGNQGGRNNGGPDDDDIPF